MVSTKRSTLAAVAIATAAVTVLSAAAPVSATSNQDLHCPDYNTAPGKVEAGKLPATLTLDNAEIKISLGSDKKFVSFMNDANEPLSVEYCIKASEGASGKQTGTEGNVTWETNGGQTPEISYVIVYGIETEEEEDEESEEENDTPVNNEDNDEGEVQGDETSKGEDDNNLPAKEGGGTGNLPAAGLGAAASAAVVSIVAFIIAASATLHHRATDVKESVQNFFGKKK